MKRLNNQRGFAILEVLLLVVLVGIIAFVAWRVIEATGDVETAQNQVPLTSAPPTGDIPAANNSSDLGTLENQLNSTQIDDSTATELDTETTF